jgi:hypothetical protein
MSLLTALEREAITDSVLKISVLKIQSIQASLEHVDEAKVPGISTKSTIVWQLPMGSCEVCSRAASGRSRESDVNRSRRRPPNSALRLFQKRLANIEI